MSAVENTTPPQITQQWLDTLYGTVEGGWLTMFSLDRSTGEQHVDWAEVTDTARLAAIAAKRAERCCVWFGVATRTERLAHNKRGSAEHCDLIPGLWLDVDIAGPNHKAGHPYPPDEAAALELIADFPIPPSAIVRSGGGLQPWWLFSEPIPAHELVPVLRSWGATWDGHAAAHGWHLDNVYDVARIMRLPGTWNRKQRSAVAVEVIADNGGRYGIDDLDQYLCAAPEPPPVYNEARVAYIGPERPGDAFNATHGGGEILSQLGFTFARRDSTGDEHWVRPGKEKRDGTSATVYAEDGHTTIWSETVTSQWPNLAVKRPYDPFGLAVNTIYNGDWAQATRDLRAKGYGTPIQPADLDWIDLSAFEEQGEEEQDVAPAGLEIRWVDDLARHAMPPEPPVLIEGLLRRGEMCVFGAPRAIGKTWLAYNLAIRLSEGSGKFLGNLDVRQASNVLYLQGELDQWGSATRWQMLTGLDMALPRVAETFDRIRFKALKRRINRNVGGVSVTDEYVDADIDGRLEQAIVDHDIDVVIVDPWAVFLAASENSNDEVEAVLGALREITLRTGVAWVIIHHITGKAERSNWTEPEDLWRGATRLADWASTRVTVLPHYTQAQYKEKGMSRREARRHVDVHFLRRSTPTDDFSMVLDGEGWWQQWNPDDEPDTTYVLRLARALSDAGGSIGSVRAASEALGLSNAKMKEVVAEAEQMGLVTTSEGARGAVVITLTEGIQHPWEPRNRPRGDCAPPRGAQSIAQSETTKAQVSGLEATGTDFDCAELRAVDETAGQEAFSAENRLSARNPLPTEGGTVQSPPPVSEVDGAVVVADNTEEFGMEDMFP